MKFPFRRNLNDVVKRLQLESKSLPSFSFAGEILIIGT